MTECITPLILTYNESPNIDRSLACLTWAKEIIVVDSFSTDGTVERLKTYPQVRLFQRAFDDHTSQWNFGLAQVASPWVLSLDADYIVPREALVEIASLDLVGTDIAAWFAHFKYCIFGKPLRASLYPPRAVLFRKSLCTFRVDGHTQLLWTDGKTAYLSRPLIHDDRKPLSRWFSEQLRYAELESHKLLVEDRDNLSVQDRLRRLAFPAPFLVFMYTLFCRKLILDGWAGWAYTLQRTFAELLLALTILEKSAGDCGRNPNSQ
jgi:glycosyltransferase involved in cell wall biosynthesis